MPINIHEYNRQSLSELIAGYFDSDGHITYYKKRKTVRIVLTSNVRPLLEEIKYQLTKFGIHGKITKEKRTGGYNSSQDHVYRYYITTITDVIRFANNIKLLSKKKQIILNRIFMFSS